MQVGIYNRWLATLGGGERHSLAIAEYLSRENPVTVITHQPVDRDRAASRLNLDLARVDFQSIPDQPPSEITPLTSDYDFFLNASYLDFFPSEAQKSAALIYFPTPVEFSRVTNIHRQMKLAVKRLLLVPWLVDGFHTVDMQGASFRWTVESPVKLWLPVHRSGYRLRFQLAALDPGEAQARLLLNGREVETLHLSPEKVFTDVEICLPESNPGAYHELVILSQGEGNGVGGAGQPAFQLAEIEVENPRYRFYNAVFERWIKDWGWRLHIIPKPVSPILKSLETYDAIWANSEFTRRWIKQYWKRSSEVLYPPVDVSQFAPQPKQNWILSVGRFFAGSHNKKHPVMVQAFKEIVDQGLTGWELHLAGGTTPGGVHQSYLQEVIDASAGYPISIHPDLPYEQLAQLYAESALYWHASGFMEDENREPAKFEHFGITTVEAMASGCVPVVIGKGGQPEIVKHGQNGFLWQTTGQLKGLTWRLVRDPDLRQRLGQAAVLDSRRYDKENFCQTLHRLLQQLGID